VLQRSFNPPPPPGQGGRVGNHFCCAVCERPLKPKRASRRQTYCSEKCRKKAQRARNWAVRYQIPDPSGSVQNNSVTSTVCETENRDGGSATAWPVDLIGHGSFRPPRNGYDPELLNKIVEVELMPKVRR